MENKEKGTKEMFEMLVGIVGIVVTVVSIIVTVISIWQSADKKEHQKSNRDSTKS